MERIDGEGPWTLERYDDPVGFLVRAERFLRRAEDHHNLILGLALSRASRDAWEPEAFFGVVADAEGAVVGCVFRTPPHKVLLTALPEGAAAVVVEGLYGMYAEVPAFLGPVETTRRVADAWVGRRGGSVVPGMPQGLYRLDEVIEPDGVSGDMRPALPAEADLLSAWGVAFGRDTGIPFPPGRAPVLAWIEANALYVWEDEGVPVSVSVAQARTGRGVRIGYVYTPPERRGRGYASALVATLSARMLAEGCAFCVLYTDLSNPTSNGIYRRLGYRLLDELRDFEIESASEPERRGR